MLDLIDSHVIVILNTFSTPVDTPLEQLRQALGELDGMGDPLAAAVSASTWFDQIRRCQAQLAAVDEQIAALGPAADAARGALYYLGGELKTLADNSPGEPRGLVS